MLGLFQCRYLSDDLQVDEAREGPGESPCRWSGVLKQNEGGASSCHFMGYNYHNLTVEARKVEEGQVA